MTFQQELSSWNPFNNPQRDIKHVPAVGAQAPSTPQFQVPQEDEKPTVITFLRHCGCPFAEKVFRHMRDVAEQNKDIHFIAVSHSDQSATDKWLDAVGGHGKVQVVVDDQRQSFAEYGLGYSSFWAVLNPWSLTTAINLGRKEGINIRPTESGSRWQISGLFAADGKGKLTYSHQANTSDDLGDLDAALQSVAVAVAVAVAVSAA